MTFKRTYERWGLKDGGEKLRIERPVEANSTGGQGSRRAVAPSDDDDDCLQKNCCQFRTFNSTHSVFRKTADLYMRDLMSSLRSWWRLEASGILMLYWVNNRGIALLFFFLSWTLNEFWWSLPRPVRFDSRKDQVRIAEEVGWMPGLVLRGAKNLATTGI
jgi:hypothetical protein